MVLPPSGAPSLPRAGPGGSARPILRRLRAAFAVGVGLVVFVAGIVVITAASTAREPQLGDKPSGQVIALVPGGEWSNGNITVAREALIDMPPGGTVMLARSDGEDPLAQVAFLRANEEALPDLDETEEPVLVGAHAGYVGVDEFSGHSWVITGTQYRHITMWSGPSLPQPELLALAASLDLSRPVREQELVDGWRVATTAHEALDGGTIREIDVVSERRGADLHIATRMGVDAKAVWILGSATVAFPVEVRGRSGLASQRESNPNEVVLTWLEQPKMVVQMTYRRTTPRADGAADEVLRDALDAAARLVPADRARWVEVAGDADEWTREPDAFALAAREVAAATTVVHSGDLGDGRRFQVLERHDTVLCVEVDGFPPLSHCDLNPTFWRGRSGAALPRHVDPGELSDARSPVLVYGYLPERAMVGDLAEVQASVGPDMAVGQAIAVEVDDVRGRPQGWATISGDAWALHVNDVSLALVVTYHFLDGTELVIPPDPRRPAEEEVLEKAKTK